MASDVPNHPTTQVTKEVIAAAALAINDLPGQTDERKAAEDVQAIFEVIYLLVLDLTKLEGYALTQEVLIRGCTKKDTGAQP